MEEKASVPQGEIEGLIKKQTGIAEGDISDNVRGSNILSWLVNAGDTTPPWWSRARDRYLMSMWMNSDHLSTAVYNSIAKISQIPFRVISRDQSDPEMNEKARKLEYRLRTASEFGKGWEVAYKKYILDLITKDNGGFLEVMGAGPKTGPIIGGVVGLRHLDSMRCTRTANPEFPVIYESENGGRYKMHYSRVIYASQMPSSRSEMNEVGFCAVSRAVEVAKTLMDMTVYNQERLGGRPHNQILIGRQITAAQLRDVLRAVDAELDSRGFRRYAKTVVVGGKSQDIDIKKVDLTHDAPFDQLNATNLGMYLISSAFGMDVAELWPTNMASGSKEEANLKRRSRGRLPSQITSHTKEQFDLKVLPPSMEMVFDFRDDSEDQQRALVKDIRARNRERELGTGSINIRTARLKMLKDGDVTQQEFNDMEIRDGRMPDGSPISMLFFSDDPIFKDALTFREEPLSSKPMSFLANITPSRMETDPVEFIRLRNDMADKVIGIIEEQQAYVLQRIAKTNSISKKERFVTASHALDWLLDRYNSAAGRGLPDVPMQQRRLRTDIRVQPDENSPENVSPAEESMKIDEEIT